MPLKRSRRALLFAALGSCWAVIAIAPMAVAGPAPNPTPSYTFGYTTMLNDGEQGYFELRAQGVPLILSNQPDLCDGMLQATVSGMALGTRPWMTINSTDYLAGCNAAVQELVAKGYAR